MQAVSKTNKRGETQREVQKHDQDASVLAFLLHSLTVSRVRAANLVRRSRSDSRDPCYCTLNSTHSLTTAPYKLSQVDRSNRPTSYSSANVNGQFSFSLTIAEDPVLNSIVKDYVIR